MTLVLALSLCLAVATPVMAATITVPGDYSTIGAAITAASPGDTINVAPGTYAENVLINKALTLVSTVQNGANIQGNVSITVNSVTVDGFHITNFGQIPVPDYSGVYIPSGTGVVVINNLIDGIAIDPVTHLTVGVHTLYGGNAGVLVKDNVIQNVRMGIYNQGSTMNIEGNTINNASHCGIGVDTSLGTTITGNTISGSGDVGIEVFGSNVVVHLNNITGYDFGLQTSGPNVDAENNWWGNATGPNNPDSNPSGTGVGVSNNVAFAPWLTGPFTGTGVNLTADVPDIVAISVSPTNIDYGTLIPGQNSAVKPIDVTNIGTHAADVDAAVSGDPGDLFYEFLYLANDGAPAYTSNHALWNNIVSILAMSATDTIQSQLRVGSSYVPQGAQTAQLTFTATAH
jgi:parallel beta-helix repeat protein